LPDSVEALVGSAMRIKHLLTAYSLHNDIVKNLKKIIKINSCVPVAECYNM